MTIETSFSATLAYQILATEDGEYSKRVAGSVYGWERWPRAWKHYARASFYVSLYIFDYVFVIVTKSFKYTASNNKKGGR